jgi:GTPase SAR1 family protein
MSKLFIGILGTSASGKSTLAMELAAYFSKKKKNCTYLSEYARTAIERYGKLDTLYKERLVFLEQKDKERIAQETYDVVVCDNPLIGYIPWAYNVVDFKEPREVNIFFQTVGEAYTSSLSYTSFVYLPYLETKKDMVRMHEPDIVKRVDTQILSLLDFFGLPYHKIMSNDEIDGEGSRLKECIEKIGVK